MTPYQGRQGIAAGSLLWPVDFIELLHLINSIKVTHRHYVPAVRTPPRCGTSDGAPTALPTRACTRCRATAS